MNRSSYRERDYAFGLLMLTLRASIGQTQAGLADLLGASRRAVAEWEAGSSYPKAEHGKAFFVLCVLQQDFAIGREAEEIHALCFAALPGRPRPAFTLLPPAPRPVGSLKRRWRY